jgi:hypothetical protein
MQHSTAARFAVRPVARFAHPDARERTRRLGLRGFGSFRPAPARATVLLRAEVGPLVALRASWRTIAPAAVRRSRRGSPRPAVAMTWARSGRARGTGRPGAEPAAWRG